MKIRLANSLQKGSIVDGEGIRAVIWTQGCTHNCPGCHNPETHSFDGGFVEDTRTIKNEISKLTLESGITFSGGDPILQVDACLDIAKFAKECNLNVWCYTGFTFEELLKMSETKSKIKEFLKFVDILVDGKFLIEQKSLNLKFRGSKNQRIIDVKKSLEREKVVLVSRLMKIEENTVIKKMEEELFI